jgi:hypothetical protein
VQVRRVGQVRQLVLVAGPQPQQIGVDPVRGRGAFVHQLVAVLGQHPQIRGVAGHRPDRRQGWLAGGVQAIATASTGSVLPWPGRLNRSREVIKGGTSTTFRSRLSR